MNQGPSPWSGFSYIVTNLARFIRPGELVLSSDDQITMEGDRAVLSPESVVVLQTP